MRLRTTLAVLTACAVGLVAGGLLLGDGVSGAGPVPAGIKGYAFTPADLEVSVGDTVTWTNSDTAPHTVTSTGGGPLDSPNLEKGDTWSFTFTKPGTYPFYCAVHPDMKGTVTVTGAAAAPATPATTPTTTPTTMDMGHGSTPTTAAPTGEAATPTGSPTPAGTPTGEAATPTGGGSMDMPSAPSSTGLVEGILEPLWVHLEKGHLEASPAQQVSDILSLDQYVKTHTVLVESMLEPLLGLTSSTSDVLSPFWVHVKKGHLEASPAQQVSDILSADQYVKTHTVLVETMVAPIMAAAVGGGG